MHRFVILMLSLVLISAMSACGHDDESLEPFGYHDSKLSDSRYNIIRIGAFNYTDYDIYAVKLLPPDKDNLDYAADSSGDRAIPPTATDWSWREGGSPGMAWDMRWETPKKFKVWWLRMVDEKAYEASQGYDDYANKDTQPGLTWCEGEITVDRPPEKGASNAIMLHFYPDGRVEGEMYVNTGGMQPKPRVDIAKRYEQPKLEGRACLKEIANPLYGRKHPIGIR